MSVELLVRQVQQQRCTAATRKEEKYAELDSHYLYEPIAVETVGVFNTSANSLLKETGLKIYLNIGESRETSFLYQRISINQSINQSWIYIAHTRKASNVLKFQF